MRVTLANLRHLLQLFRYGRRPAITVYESIGADSPLAPAPGWLNLGLWEGPGDEEEAPSAVRRLVSHLASVLPREGTIIDVANGLGAQDQVIAELTRPRLLVAVNLTESQLLAGRERLATARARPVVADAVKLPFADDCADGVISVEAAFHFSSRLAFFREVARILRPGAVLSVSDVSAERGPRSLREAWAGFTLLRFWGLQRSALQSSAEIRRQAEAAGLVDLHIERVGSRVFEPILRLARHRLNSSPVIPVPLQWAGGFLVRQWTLLWRRGLLDYLLMTARAPD